MFYSWFLNWAEEALRSLDELDMCRLENLPIRELRISYPRYSSKRT